MKRFIKSLAWRYLINVLMIVAFGISSWTGLIRPGGGHGERHHDFRSEQYAPEREISTAGFSGLSERQNTGFYERSHSMVQENIHIWFGLCWLGLMMFHAFHHWNWFKKMFSVKHIMKNKLLTATVIIFILLAFSGIAMWTEIIPRGLINLREIHEMTGQILLVLMAIHILQRIKWYFKVPSGIFKRKTVLA
jgi:hypothetical protein